MRLVFHSGRTCHSDKVMSPWLRRVVRATAVTAILLVVPLVIGAFADAQGTMAARHLTVNVLDWTNVHDSSGVKLSDYLFVTSDGSLFRPAQTLLIILLRLEFLGWWILLTLSIWLIGWVLSFAWLNTLSHVMDGVSHSLVHQFATAPVMFAAATFGAFFVAYFVARGFYGRATRQIVVMMVVALTGLIFLAEPLGLVLGPNGALMKGRDFGVAVAAGLNGNPNPDPRAVVASMQSTLTDGFARHPLQVWNFGHVLDGHGSCGASWSSGMASGDAALVRVGLQSCGDSEAFNAVTNPNMSDTLVMLGSGALLLVFGFILMAFAVSLSVRIMWLAFDTVEHGLMAIFGFAAGGFVYGPTQTFLIRNLVDCVFAGLRVAAYTIFLGVYVLFLGNLFRESGGQVLWVLMLASMVEVVAFLQIHRLSAAMDRGGQWVAARFARATQGPETGGGQGGGGRSSAGVGSHALTGLHLLAMMTAMNTMNTNPVVEWLSGGGTTAFSPLARGRLAVDRMNVEIARNRWLSATQRRGQHYRDVGDVVYDIVDERLADGRFGDIDHITRFMFIADGLDTAGLSKQDMGSSLVDNGYTPEEILYQTAVYANVNAHVHMVSMGFKRRVTASAALKYYLAKRGENDELEKYAKSQMLVGASGLFTHTPVPIRPGLISPFRHAFDSAVNRSDVFPSRARHRDLEDVIPDQLWQNASGDDLRFAAERIAIGWVDAAKNAYRDPSNDNVREVERWDAIARSFDTITDALPANPWPGPIYTPTGRTPWNRRS